MTSRASSARGSRIRQPRRSSAGKGADDPLGDELLRDEIHAEAHRLDGGGRRRADRRDPDTLQVPDVPPPLPQTPEERGDAVRARKDDPGVGFEPVESLIERRPALRRGDPDDRKRDHPRPLGPEKLRQPFGLRLRPRDDDPPAEEGFCLEPVHRLPETDDRPDDEDGGRGETAFPGLLRDIREGPGQRLLIRRRPPADQRGRVSPPAFRSGSGSPQSPGGSSPPSERRAFRFRQAPPSRCRFSPSSDPHGPSRRRRSRCGSGG